jgi:hypothetical protein
MPQLGDDGPKRKEKPDELSEYPLPPSSPLPPEFHSEVFKPRKTPLEMKGHTLSPVSPEDLYQQIIGSQAIEGFEPFHQSAGELLKAREEEQRVKKSKPNPL